MNTKTFIEDFKANQRIEEILFLAEFSLKTTQKGKEYLDLVLSDRTGKIPGKIWDKLDRVSEGIKKGDFVRVAGVVQEYRENLQIKVDSMTGIPRDQLKMEDFIESLEQEKIETYLKKFKVYIDEISDPYLKALLDSFFQDIQFQTSFIQHPAAQSIHHEYLGGLLEHTLTMLAIGRYLAKIYKDIDNDLLAAGIILHDIGKMRELEADVTVEYTHQGRLLGHSIIGLEMIREKTRQIPGFPAQLVQLLEHILISHHGTAEFGATKPPLFREAMLVHLIDTIDARMKIMEKYLRKVPADEMWSEKCWPVENQKLLRIDRYLEDSGKNRDSTQPE